MKPSRSNHSRLAPLNDTSCSTVPELRSYALDSRGVIVERTDQRPAAAWPEHLAEVLSSEAVINQYDNPTDLGNRIERVENLLAIR
jgi:hypothetical protein